MVPVFTLILLITGYLPDGYLPGIYSFSYRCYDFHNLPYMYLSQGF